ncbi:unnamed protein product [Amoebophrya sp. A120]|nr:unnamed protein product [Amoebophrya sp. A120]|eukprot:GSA120T00003827001.1
MVSSNAGTRATSFQVMDRIMDVVAHVATQQVIVAGHSGGAQFVQRWSLVSQMHIPEEKDFRVQLVFGSASSYGYLDHLRPTKEWKASQCLGGSKSASCYAPDQVLGGPSASKWTASLHDQVPDELKEAMHQKGAVSDREDIVGNATSYMPVRSWEDLDRDQCPKQFWPELLRSKMHCEQTPAAGILYVNDYSDESDRISIEKVMDVSQYLRTEYFPRFQTHIVINEGDRCACLDSPEGSAKEKTFGDYVRNKETNNYGNWIFPDDYCTPGSFSDTWLDACAFPIQGKHVDARKLAWAQGLSRYQRGWAYYYWLRFHAGDRYLPEEELQALEKYSVKPGFGDDDNLGQQDTHDNELSRALVQFHHHSTFRHTWTNAKRRIRYLLKRRNYHRNKPPNTRKSNRYAGYYAKKLGEVRVALSEEAVTELGSAAELLDVAQLTVEDKVESLFQ